MSKRKRKPDAHKAQDLPREQLDEQRRAKRREWVGQYRKRPEVLEKHRNNMAERRAAVQALRRQWDPPKKLKPVVHESEAPNIPDTSRTQHDASPDSDSSNNDIVSLTSAERFAIAVLSGMVEAHTVEDQVGEHISALTLKYGPSPASPLPTDSRGVGERYANSDSIDSVLELAMQLNSCSNLTSRHSPSRESSVVGVNEEAINKPKEQPESPWWMPGDSGMPAYASPATPAQKKIRRELGVIGPLTPVQQAQVMASMLANPPSTQGSDGEIADTIRVPWLSTARWERVWKWRREIEHDTDWDTAARRAFAEATLCRRLLY
ncbi:hypothetical protein B0H10DRAFT_2015516 [Mycena sp. CBHHK59/15]|nr:hypothetical protein B0H10DRAFT_2015516 [Mycena sp. CBHHK59/15]